MRSGFRQQAVGSQSHQLFHVNFHEFIEQENQKTSLEMADEFGLSLREVKQLKQKLGRN
ncbi:hypothetical protein [Bacillus sp. FJAT-45350]|uniref:hypothetical protein n=1 Tax=Bacillus sp. FJAT-45350 TaxID=2011014 RepID=UPI0015CBD2C5|nr:hypothetical protein [Bacillus sp. FJAT-45350]